MSARDRFKAALRLSAETEGVKLRDAKEEMRPRSKREIDEVVWLQHQARERFGELCADDVIVLSFCRLLRLEDYEPATSFDWEILRHSDDRAIADLVWGEERRARLRELRDLMPSTAVRT